MHPCTCRIAATDPASHGSHPYSSFAQGLAWANNVLEPDRIGWSFDVITDNPRCVPLGLELENHIDVSISIDIIQGDCTGVASVPVASKRTVVGFTSEA